MGDFLGQIFAGICAVIAAFIGGRYAMKAARTSRNLDPPVAAARLPVDPPAGLPPAGGAPGHPEPAGRTPAPPEPEASVAPAASPAITPVSGEQVGAAASAGAEPPTPLEAPLPRVDLPAPGQPDDYAGKTWQAAQVAFLTKVAMTAQPHDLFKVNDKGADGE